jgi:hypothetical protein
MLARGSASDCSFAVAGATSGAKLASFLRDSAKWIVTLGLRLVGRRDQVIEPTAPEAVIEPSRPDPVTAVEARNACLDEVRLPFDPLWAVVSISSARPHRWGVVTVWVVAAIVEAMLRLAQPAPGSTVARPDLSEILIAVCWIVLGLPAAIYLYLWVPGAVLCLIPELERSGVLPINGGRAERDQLRLRRMLGSPVWAAIALLGAEAYAIYRITGWPLGPPPTTPTLVLALGLLVTVPLAYAGTISVIRLVIGIAAHRDLFRHQPVTVHPLHPDSGGGFGPLGERVVVLARIGALYGTALVLINVIATQAGRLSIASPETIGGAASFVILMPLVVVAWLEGPHQAMRDARDLMLKPLQEAYAAAINRPIPGPDSGSKDGESPTGASLSSGTDYLVALETRRDVIVRDVPVWPLHTPGVRVLSATLLAPLIPVLVSIIGKVISAWLHI